MGQQIVVSLQSFLPLNGLQMNPTVWRDLSAEMHGAGGAGQAGCGC